MQHMYENVLTQLNLTMLLSLKDNICYVQARPGQAAKESGF